MSNVVPIKGHKGGGGGSAQAPVVVPDNLRSKDTVEVILALCEGPIFGLENGDKSFNVGETPLQNFNGDYNFKKFMLKVLSGTDEPDFIVPVLGGQSSNNTVNLALGVGVPVVRQTQSGQIDFLDVRLAISRLLRTDTKGTWGLTATLNIEYKPLSSLTWVSIYGGPFPVTGKTSSTYIKEFRIAVARINEPYQVRVTLVGPASSTDVFCDIGWESLQETIAGAAQYPNTAVAHLVVESSDQFSSIPQWSGIYKTRLVNVPTNYDPETRIYSGVWDGTWKVAYTNNPAWCFYDYVMNTRFGIGYYYPEVNLNRYDTYEAAKWCDEMVPDGRGGMQPRYTMNLNIAEARNGRELAKYMAGAFNAVFFDDLDGRAFLRVDKDEDACHIFTRENTYEDSDFEYTYTDITTRYNDITVTFVNPDLNWVEDRRRIFDQSLIDKNGPVPLDFIAVGCIDFHEAERRAHYKMITSNTENCIITFKTNRRGQMVNPFDVMLISDPDMGYGISGRAKSVSTDRKNIALRDPIYLEAGISYNIKFELSDGSFLVTELTNTVTGYNQQLQFKAELPEDVTPDRIVFTLEHPTLIGLPRPFRVTKVEEMDGNPDVYILEGVNINRNKWYDADNITNSGVITYGVTSSPFNPPGPDNVTFDERFIRADRAFHLTISPQFNRGLYKYYANDHSFEVWSRPKDSGEPFVKQVLYWGDTIINHPPGLTEFKILGRSYLGYTTNMDTAIVYTYNVANPLDPPIDIDWVRINKRELYWGYANPPDDFDGFQVRYHNQASRTTWDDAIIAHQGLLSASQFYTNLIPVSARTIMVRPIDLFGIPSENSAIVFRDLGSVETLNVTERTEYNPLWGGTKLGCAVEDGELRATDTGGKFYSGIGTAQVYDGGLMYESTYEELYYTDNFEIFGPGYLTIEIDFDGDGYEVNIRELGGDGIWKPVPERMFIETGEWEIRLRIFGGRTRGIVRSFATVVDVEDIEEDIQDINVGLTGRIRLPITKNYAAIKVVSVTIQYDPAKPAFTWRLIDKDKVLGPEIELLDINGDPAEGLIDATIKGY